MKALKEDANQQKIKVFIILPISLKIFLLIINDGNAALGHEVDLKVM